MKDKQFVLVNKGRIKYSTLSLFVILSIIVIGSLLSIAATVQDTFILPSKSPTDFAAATKQLDHYIALGWKEQDLKPSPNSTDEEFLRRVTIDITGEIPTATEVSEFLKNPSPTKRQEKIEELLNSKVYGDNWANIWTKWLVGRQYRQQLVKPRELKDWLADAFNKDMPYDQFVTAILTADGSTMDNPAGYYIVRYEAKPEDLAGNAARLFMAKQIQCAQCHNHPYEKDIKQQDFWAMAAFFARTKYQEVREDKKVIGSEVYDRPRGDVYIPNKEDQGAIQPKFITGETIDNSFRTNRRVELARLITSPNDPYFAKAIVNRMWDHFMGRGIVDPIDDLSHAPTHPELLNFLADDFIKHNYDLKYLTRVITNSKTYQLSSRSTPDNEKDHEYYTHAYLRPLSAEELFYSLMASTGVEQTRKNITPDQMEKLKDGYLRKFVFIFDNDEMEEDESFQGTIPQALMLLNGNLVNQGIKARPGGGTLETIVRNAKSDSERIDWLYLATLSRYPLPEEKQYCFDYIDKMSSKSASQGTGVSLYASAVPGPLAAADKKNNNQFDNYLKRRPAGFSNPALEDIFWALLNSPEFILNH